MRICADLFLLLVVLSPAVAKPRVAVINVQQAIIPTQDGKAAAAALTSKYAPDQVQQEIDDLNRQLRDGTPRTEQESEQLRARIDTLIRSHRRNKEDLRAKIRAGSKASSRRSLRQAANRHRDDRQAAAF